MNARPQFAEPANALANEYAGRCGRMSAELIYAEVCLRVALDACTTEARLRLSVLETLGSIQRTIREMQGA